MRLRKYQLFKEGETEYFLAQDQIGNVFIYKWTTGTFSEELYRFNLRELKKARDWIVKAVDNIDRNMTNNKTTKNEREGA